MNDTASLTLSNLIYDGLLSFTPNLELKGMLAESWTTSLDGKTLTFRLRKSAKFQNGKLITPEDVLASFRRLVAPTSKVFTYYDCIEGAPEFHAGRSATIAGLRKTGASEVSISLRYPFPPFLSVLAGATAKILPASAATEVDFFRHPVGSGPFKYESAVATEHHSDTVLRKFSDYHGAVPKVSTLVLRAMDEPLALAEAANGKIDDLTNWPLTGSEPIFSVGRHLKSPVAATWIIGLNARLAPFNDENVRRAFKKSVDSEQFRKLFHPDAIPANGYIPAGLAGFQWGYGATKPPKAPAVEVSKKLIRIAIPNVLSAHMAMKDFLEKSLRQQGWNIEVIPMSWATLMKGYSEKTNQAFLVSMNMDYPDTEFLVRNFESTNLDNFSGLADKEVDILIRKARSTVDRIQRQKIYIELVKKLNRAAPTVNLFHPRGHYWVSKCVSGLEPNLLADVYIDYRNVEKLPNCEVKAIKAAL